MYARTHARTHWGIEAWHWGGIGAWNWGMALGMAFGHGMEPSAEAQC